MTSRDQVLNTEECWICRRTEKELLDIGVELTSGEVPYEVGAIREPGKATIAVCLICDYLINGTPFIRQ